MMHLYEINQGITECLDMETGEILDAERLDALQLEKAEKLEGVACWVKDLLAEADALKTEKDALAKRQKAKEALAERLKGWLAEACEGQKFESSRAVVSFRRSEAVEVENEETFAAWAAMNFPELLTIRTPAPNKAAIKVALKAGDSIPGCKMAERTNTIIK